MPVSDPNRFDLYVGISLAKLYEARPTRLSFIPADFGLAEKDEGLGPSVGKEWDGWANTIQWLHREGYIRYEGFATGTMGEPVFIDVELSEKGFRALNSLPVHLRAPGEKRSLGSLLVDALKQAGARGAGKILDKGGEKAARRLSDLVQSFFS